VERGGLKPYWGKPAVRNFRGGGGNVVQGLVTFCHAVRKGGYAGSHWPTRWRASSLLDGWVLSGYDLQHQSTTFEVVMPRGDDRQRRAVQTGFRPRSTRAMASLLRGPRAAVTDRVMNQSRAVGKAALAGQDGERYGEMWVMATFRGGATGCLMASWSSRRARARTNARRICLTGGSSPHVIMYAPTQVCR